jgi:tRNA threonylcarbamoyladenosine biosynthesis protein TsaB
MPWAGVSIPWTSSVPEIWSTIAIRAGTGCAGFCFLPAPGSVQLNPYIIPVMKILALDTSTEYCSLALWLDGEIVERDVLAGQRHSEMILPMLKELLQGAGLELAALNGVAFGSGPGSFTGLRIACGVAQGLAIGAGLPVAGICTLEALAAGTGDDRVIACLDARMGEVYHASYERRKDVWYEHSPPGLFAPRDVPLPEAGEWTGCGSGFLAHGEALRTRHGGLLKDVLPEVHPHARDIAALGADRFAKGGGVAPDLAAPLYIRDKVALKTSER